MEEVRLLLMRMWNRDKYVIGRLYIDGEFYCNTLEDTDRGLSDTMTLDEIKKKKVYGETAIPSGKYEVIFNYSPKYKKTMPLLLNVKGYSGIRIHSGNTHKDTEGCILVGDNKVVGQVVNSRIRYNALVERLKGKKVTIEIVRTYNV